VFWTGDTFDMKVTRTGTETQKTYNDQERIRIAKIASSDPDTPAGSRSKEALEKKLVGKEVRCYVKSRDTGSRIVADVKVM